MSTEALTVGTRRIAHLGVGAVERLAEVLDQAPPGRTVVLGSPSYSADQHSRICRAAGRNLPSAVVPRGLDAVGVARLKAELSGFGVLIGVGGGAVMDAAKVVSRPGVRYLVLIPKTLSGSEHSANTSWWQDGTKHISCVGYADAVIADPLMLVADAEVIATGALSCLAHALAAVAEPALPTPLKYAAAAGAHDLVTGLGAHEGGSGTARDLLRGSWNASVSFISSGPMIGFHHWTVHALARPGEHARLSSYLLCQGLLQSDIYRPGLRFLANFRAGLPTALTRIAQVWANRLGMEPPVPQLFEDIPAHFRDEAQTLIGLLP